MEYFPTVVRNSAMSFKTTFSRFGAVIAPQIFMVSHSRSFFSNQWISQLPLPWLPYALLAILAFADTIAFLVIMPETKGKPLAETMPEKKKKNLSQIPIQPQFSKV